MKKKILLILSLTVATNAMALDADEARKAYEVRHSIFELLLWNVAPLAGMVKNEVPFDADRAKLNASRIAALTPMIPDAFVVDTRGFDLDTEAKDVIWQDKKEFLRLAANIEEKSLAFEAAAATGDFQEFSAAFLDMGQACKDCHERFRKD